MFKLLHHQMNSPKSLVFILVLSLGNFILKSLVTSIVESYLVINFSTYLASTCPGKKYLIST